MKLLNIFNPLMYYYKYNLKHQFTVDPYNQAARLFKATSQKSISPKKVLIVPFRGADSNFFEGNCAIILKARGYEVDALMCGQELTHCEQIDFTRDRKFRCNLCFYEQNKFISAFGVSAVFLHQYVSSEEMKEIDSHISQLDLNELNNHTYKDIPIYGPLNSALLLYFKRASYCSIKDRKIITGYLRTILITINALDNYLKVNKIEFMLLSHGVYSTWGTVQEYCLKRSIKFVTWGREYNGAGVIAAHNASYLNEPMYEKNSIWNQKPLSEKQKNKITNYLEAKVGLSEKVFDYVNYNRNIRRILPKSEIYKKLNLSGKKIVGLFPNIPWDGQTFRPNYIFKDLNEWIYETIEWFAKREDCVLVIRAHPAEKYSSSDVEGVSHVIARRYREDSLPDNIILISPDSDITSLSVASISCAALLYGSTIGYETTFLRVPTILASEFFYSNKEISFDPKTKEAYFSLIAQAIEGNLQVDDERFERLLQFAYHYQFRRVMPETLMNLNGLTFNGYKHLEKETFINDKVINKFIDKCITEEKFYFDECYD